MSWMRPLGNTGMEVSAIGLGTVKLGRTAGLKYSTASTLPDDRRVQALLAQSRDLGINLLDTAPAYGSSEERLGTLLAPHRNDWLICSKVGEEFEDGMSRFDFSAEATRASVHRSLRRLNTDVIDIVLIHSDGNDLHILEELGTLGTLQQLKREGLVRACGISTKTLQGGIAAAAVCDVVMLTYNLVQREEEQVLAACARSGCGALIKKMMASGDLGASPGQAVQQSMQLVLRHTGTSAALVGTLSPQHLQANVDYARTIVG